MIMQYKSNLFDFVFFKNGTDGTVKSNTAPADKTKLWLDTSVNPNILKYWNGTEWVMINDQSATYKSLLEVTSKEINAEVSKKVGQDELNNKISLTADAFNTELSKKVGKTEIISQINQTAETVKIQANKINLVGSVTAQDLKVDNLSSISANLGTVTAGTIKGTTIDGATITGGTISSGTTINVATDLTVGNNMYLGTQESSGATIKRLYLTPTAYLQRLTHAGGTETVELHSGQRLTLRSDYKAISSDTFALIALHSTATESSIGLSATNIYANDKKIAVEGDYSPLGNTDGTGMELLWSGTSQAPSFTVSNIDQYKFFLVQPGTADSSYGTMIVVPHSGSHASGHFRGIGGYETTSNTNGGEIYFLRGTISGSTVSIASCWSRKTASFTTNGSTTQVYVKYIVGVR